jgi:hypothetical protein
VSTENTVSPVASAEIEHFVRDTLGCRCPDEVFRSVSIEPSSATGIAPAALRVSVGGRLLIHVVALPPDAAAGSWIERLAGDGMSQRDRAGFNRFRLVLVASANAEVPADLALRFARAAGGDERAHLHLAALDDLPPSLRPPALSAANRR